MKFFTSGNLLVGALLKTKLQKVYEKISDQKLKFAIGYLPGGDYVRNNVGIASIQKSNISIREDFIAFSNVNSITAINDADKNLLNRFNLSLCLKDEKTLPVKRLGVNNLEIYIPTSLGFAESKVCCTERKIISKIMVMMKAKNIEEGKLGGTLYLYTKLEPCVYCMTALSDFIEYTGTKVLLLYEELIFEIVRDNLTSGPKFITNLINPTNFDKLNKYDPALANMVRADYQRRGKIFN